MSVLRGSFCGAAFSVGALRPGARTGNHQVAITRCGCRPVRLSGPYGLVSDGLSHDGRMRLVTGLSLAANVVGLALAAVVVRKKGIGPVLRAIRPPAAEPVPYARFARERFADLPGAPVVLAGDSQAQNCPAGELFGPVAVRGIGGQTVAELHSWIGLVLADPQLRRLAVWAGTNNVLLGHAPAATGDEMAALLQTVSEQRPDVETVVLSVPPLTGRELAVAETNAALRTVTEKAGATFVDLTAVLAGGMAADGVHISPAGYARLRAVADQLDG